MSNSLLQLKQVTVCFGGPTTGVRVGLPLSAAFNNLKWIADPRMILYSLLVSVLMLARPQGLFN